LEKQGLKSQGLFRLSGDSTTMSDFVKKLESGKKVELSEMKDINCIAGLIKQYFRELPEPLCTYEYFDMFISINQIQESEEKVQMIKKVLRCIPLINVKLLKLLCEFLYKVTLHSEINKMTSENLGICFAPNLLKKRMNESLNKMEQIQEMMKFSPFVNSLMTTLIEDSTYIFSNLLEESLNESKRKNTKRKTIIEKYSDIKKDIQIAGYLIKKEGKNKKSWLKW
jgi:hypothetical protein